MKIWEFTFRLLVDEDRNYDDWIEQLFELGGDDSHPGIHGGNAYVTFTREAPSLQAAVLSARELVGQVGGLHIVRCEIPESQLAEWAA